MLLITWLSDPIHYQKTSELNSILLIYFFAIGYNVTQRNGQRIYGGPPPNWKGPAPDKGSEVFVGKVPRDMYEWELVPLFEKVNYTHNRRIVLS